MLVCKGCGEAPMSINTQDFHSCIVCFGISPDSGILIEVPDPETFQCDHCKREFSRDYLLKKWVVIPFAISKGTFYCGCKGWD